MGEGMLFFTFLLIDKQIFAPMFGGLRKKSYLCTAIQKKWRFRLGVRTHASHAWNTGSIPVVATIRSEVNRLFSSDFRFMATLPLPRNHTTKGIEHYSKAILCLVLIIIYCPSTLTLAFPSQIVAGQWKGADIRSIPKIKERGRGKDTDDRNMQNN